MPFYDLRCPKCDKEYNISASMAARDAATDDYSELDAVVKSSTCVNRLTCRPSCSTISSHIDAGRTHRPPSP